jgi:UDP-N-acetyl-D-galactosamine dehydrogenase
MGAFIAQKLVKLLVQNDVPVRRARVGILGLTFKEDVPDLRNSRVPDILRELKEFGVEARVHDPRADPGEAEAEYGIPLAPLELFRDLDAVVLAVPHAAYLDETHLQLSRMLSRNGIVIDVKSALDRARMPASLLYWSL